MAEHTCLEISVYLFEGNEIPKIESDDRKWISVEVIDENKKRRTFSINFDGSFQGDLPPDDAFDAVMFGFSQERPEAKDETV